MAGVARTPAGRLDYDDNPERFRTNSRIAGKYSAGDVHEQVAARFAGERLTPILDVGCGEGRLCALVRERGLEVMGLDQSPTMLAAVSGSRVLGDAGNMPFRADWFAGCAALWMLYDLADPSLALAEIARVLRPGGLFVCATPSRDNDPELAQVLARKPTSFDAEEAPRLVGRHFDAVEVESWDLPYIRLPTLAAVEEYLQGRGIQPDGIAAAARTVGAPLTITKRGCLIWARARVAK